MKILVVDDSKAMRSIVLRTLRQAGFSDHEFEEAADGAEALQAIQANQPDLVLADWNMPEMSGIELLEALRQASNNVKFIFVTSEGTPEMKEKASNAGAITLITKPFNADTFKECLTPVLAA